MSRVLLITVVICTFAAAAAAQMPRKPGPEHARIGYFAGQWKVEGESEGMKYSGTVKCDWFAGGFHLVCLGDGSGAFGPLKSQVVMSHDRGAKAYILQSISNVGNTLNAKGSVADKVWTWDTELVGEKGPFKARMTMTEQSPSAYEYKMEGFLGEWIVIESGRATKVTGLVR